MDKKFLNLRELIKYSDGGVLSKVIVKTNKVDITLFCMSKKTDISEHTTAKQGFIYVIEGNGIFNLEGEDIRMLPGVFIKLEKNARHSLKAENNTSFLLSLAD
jgi:quercetin dioxygenase-like cupin family protein